MEKMSIWEHASETDSSATKSNQQGGRKTTSINGYWMFKKATELWGPVGTGWGYEVVKDEYRDGENVTRADCEPYKTVMHTIVIRLWYGSDPKMSGITAYGHTPYILKTKNGPMCDMEAPKKSLTDALKKALSMLGFSYDVFSGQFDDSSYVQAIKIKESIEKAEDRDSKIQEAQEELKGYVSRNLETINGCLSSSELGLVVKAVNGHLVRQAMNPVLKEISDRGLVAVDKACKLKLKELKNEE